MAGGALWGLCFSVRPWLPLCLVGLVPLFLLLQERRAWLLGWLHGASTWTVAMFWLVDTLTTYGQLEGWLAGLLLLGLGAFLGLYHAAFAALGSRLWRREDAIAFAALPALWVVLEVLRGVLFSGFPWNLAAYAWIALPGALRLAAWIGAWGVSFLVAFVSLGVARAMAARRWQTAGFTLLSAAVLLAVGGRWAAGPAADRAASDRMSPLLRAVIVQPDTPNQVAFDAGRFESDYARLLALTGEACRPGTLVLWPESAAWPLLYGRDPRLEADLAGFAARGCSVLFNSASEAEGEGRRYFNSALLIRPGLGLERYDKRHLVPFGEYVPLAGVFSFISSLARNAGDFSPATELKLLDWEGERLGPAICYEVVFPSEVAELTRAGATALVSMTNDAWYGDTAAPWQHLRAARFRAAENRRWLLRAAITGVSAVIAPDGSLRGRMDVGESGLLQALFQGRTDLTPFARAPWAVPALCLGLVAVGLGRRPRT
ncbi:MAG: apolipoprotein N-acyltransferase [Thermoanaerobaculia bacterium]